MTPALFSPEGLGLAQRGGAPSKRDYLVVEESGSHKRTLRKSLNI